MALLALGLDNGEYFELPYTFGEDEDLDLAALQALRLFAGNIRYAQIIDSPPCQTMPADGGLDEMIAAAVTSALRLSDWSQRDAADLLRITPHQVNYRVRKYRITPPAGHKNAWRENKTAR